MAELSTTRRTSFAILAMLTVTTMAVGCATQRTAAPSTSVAEGTSRAQTAAPSSSAPAGPLDRYYRQRIDWGSCARTAQTDSVSSYDTARMVCGTVTVPIDYDAPSSGDLTLAVGRLKASGDRKASILINPGGPGASGVALVAGKSADLGKLDIATDFDQVGWDPRGVGASKPVVRCNTDAQRDAERQLNIGSDNSPAGIAKQEAHAKELAERCERAMGTELLSHMGTVDTVRDLDVLRAVLGDDKLTYLGYSYGTFIGALYADRFPDKVRAMVLDGAVDPAEDQITSNIEQMRGFQTVFNDFSAACAKNTTCPLGTDTAQSTANYQQLVRPLIDTPVRAARGRPLSYSDAITGTIQALYSPELWDALSKGLAQLKAGDGTILQRLADMYLNRDADGTYSAMMDANTATNCMDSPAPSDQADLDRLDVGLRAAAPFNDDGRGTGRGAKGVCAFWPAPPSFTPHRLTPAASLPLTVVVSTTHDPATPYKNGVSLAEQLRSRLITFNGSQHTVSFEGNSCVDGAVTAYLRDLTPPAEGLTCSGS
jgi:pimeloyl-ACP methyl ester carboxylesterase